MSTNTRCLLLDGALLQGHALMLAARATGLPLYEDLGAAAQEVGPWLLPDVSLADVDLPELPVRHGMSELSTDSALGTLRAHFGAIRYIETHDAQRYFLRYADTRAVAAMKLALHETQLAVMCGPIKEWAHIDRRGKRAVLLEGLACPRSADSRLRLSPKQLAAVLDAGLPDQLCLALEELEEPRLSPATDVTQFERVEAAAHWLRLKGIDSFPLQRAVARQVAICGGAALSTPSFMVAVEAAQQRASAALIDDWVPPARGGEPASHHTPRA